MGFLLANPNPEEILEPDQAPAGVRQVMACARALVQHEDALLAAEASAHTQHESNHGKRELGLDPLWAPERAQLTVAAFSQAPRFILLDFRCGSMPGIPPHACRGCIGRQPFLLWEPACALQEGLLLYGLPLRPCVECHQR